MKRKADSPRLHQITTDDGQMSEREAESPTTVIASRKSVSAAESDLQRKVPGSNGEDAASKDGPIDGKADEEDGEEDDEEPRLKYHRITDALKDVYRNGDAVSSFAIGGDKMVLGTHNGIIHVLLLPSFESLKVYRAHAASISHISLSPPATGGPLEMQPPQRQYGSPNAGPRPVTDDAPQSSPVGLRSLNFLSKARGGMHVGTASIDGNVCVQSLLDPKDVTIRDFARPVQALALSPQYRSDGTYLSGGRAGKLILTHGLPTGSRSKSNVDTGLAGTTSNWLGAVGLAGSSSRDQVLHSGEGTIATIMWSNSGSFVAWVNELGIKIMRSHINIQESEEAWRRICHIDRPKGAEWEEMSGSWKASMEWVNEDGLEFSAVAAPQTGASLSGSRRKSGIERLIVGWGDSVWVIQVKKGQPGRSDGKTSTAEVTHL